MSVPGGAERVKVAGSGEGGVGGVGGWGRGGGSSGMSLGGIEEGSVSDWVGSGIDWLALLGCLNLSTRTLGLGGLGFYRSGKASEMEDEVVVILRSRRDKKSFVEDGT